MFRHASQGRHRVLHRFPYCCLRCHCLPQVQSAVILPSGIHYCLLARCSTGTRVASSSKRFLCASVLLQKSGNSFVGHGAASAAVAAARSISCVSSSSLFVSDGELHSSFKTSSQSKISMSLASSARVPIGLLTQRKSLTIASKRGACCAVSNHTQRRLRLDAEQHDALRAGAQSVRREPGAPKNCWGSANPK